MTSTNLSREQLVSIMTDAQQLVQHARSALTLQVAYNGTRQEAMHSFYEDECKLVQSSVNKILEAALVALPGNEQQKVEI